MIQQNSEGMYSEPLRICDDLGIFKISKQTNKKESNVAMGQKALKVYFTFTCIRRERIIYRETVLYCDWNQRNVE